MLGEVHGRNAGNRGDNDGWFDLFHVCSNANMCIFYKYQAYAYLTSTRYHKCNLK